MEPKNHSNLEFEIAKINLQIKEIESKKREIATRVIDLDEQIKQMKDIKEFLNSQRENELDNRTILDHVIEILKKEMGPLHISSLLHHLQERKNQGVKRSTLESILVKGIKDPACGFIRVEPGVYQAKNDDG